MSRVRQTLRRAVLPFAVFGAVVAIHMAWSALFPERNPLQDRWATVDDAAPGSWLDAYLDSKSYWLAYSYALSFTFAAILLRRYRETRACSTRNAAVGGATFSGVLAVAGCYLIGCCGSPMLVVYLNLFGATFVPLAKPLVAGLSTATVLAMHWRVSRSERALVGASPSAESCSGGNCCTGNSPQKTTLSH